ncbi:MAG: LacI family transcriptional regulator [Firmicutes bacterium]|nr:LacI family transcriptional regulator [Bacillota bacterium]
MRVTIADVAAKAKVSTATVSYVLNKSNRVSKETRDRVLRAVEELGYQPNALAQGLVKNETRNIGVVIPHTAESVFSDPFFPELLKGIGTVVTREGYFLLLSLLSVTEDFVSVLSSMISQRRVDGIIVASTPRDSEVVTKVREGGLPFTLIGPCYLSDVHSIDVDNEQGAYRAARHLIELGHSQIGYISGDMRFDYAVQRYRGFQRALDEAGLGLAHVYMGDVTHQSGQRGAKHLLESFPGITALACASDMAAYGAIAAARELGLRVPADLSVVGFDDIPFAQEHEIKLTTISQPIAKLGYLASENLIARLTNSTSQAQPARQIIETELVVRDSAAAPNTARRIYR